MSREILVFIAGSLDGFIAKENDDLQWLEETEGEGDNGYGDMYQTIDTVIMGKRTYDYILEHIKPFPYPDKKCYVFSTTQTGENEHVTFIQEDVITFTQRLKEQEGTKIWMVGGGNLLDAFLQERLIDEWIITITPHLLGSGIPLFKSPRPFENLRLLETKRYGQMVQLHYEVRKEA
ncbi:MULTISPECIES: dihydrofolate reductase family protein [Lysinibacillus]|uniref:dihydrofolate reductase family protein n=1 Tax=Lysinibacillus TaxID=400634 RepID=UPI0006C9F6C4|nr:MULTISPECIES: dihydrofolate reductase family protein [Lysinibacillus]MCT1538288.1 dihydrofolate reductase family protein [Lysinibacillus capsici]MCT1568996.1 dihydrofolate reductase family protein [Lysinibacillus capsici]MCT1646012.1 dihydrofolate reductase family protein [Lysinibacillus capsici]MCT1725483.1 dihydrofolate reductase family protein [Lysinibacillus capsici]MCT1784262.1 dihydrofolate reductase family protein [Lysinibacillus capsici]